MTPWRLEMLRIWRTRRFVALLAPSVLLGLGLPILTHELPHLLKRNAGGIKVVAPVPTPADALTGFAQNTAQLGTLVVVIVAAATIAFDARPPLAAFYRTRIRRPWLLVIPRCVAVVGTDALALAIGATCCAVATASLIGTLPLGAVAAGVGVELVWVAFCVSVVAFWASYARAVMPVIGATLATLMALVFASGFSAFSPWSPTAIAGGIGAFVGPAAGLPWRSFLVAAVATGVLATIAVLRIARRSA